VLANEIYMNSLNSNNEKSKNGIKIAAALTTTILLVLALTTTSATTTQLAYSWVNPDIDPTTQKPKAPSVISGENVYVVWWTDKGTPNTNGEVMFRASTDGGATFGNKTNLSNTTTADSVDAEISADGGSVVITWWERNQTSDTPVMRVSNDSGETFGPVLNLAANGTIGVEEEAEEEEGGEAVEAVEEAVGGANVAE
jgi:hypothetical protein